MRTFRAALRGGPYDGLTISVEQDDEDTLCLPVRSDYSQMAGTSLTPQQVDQLRQTGLPVFGWREAEGGAIYARAEDTSSEKPSSSVYIGLPIIPYNFVRPMTKPELQDKASREWNG